jgi:uncharacterized protein YndB with AHSA1/START domain
LVRSPRSVSATRTIGAPAPVVFNFLANPREHARFDGSDSVRGVRDAPERLYLGAKFAMDMKMGLPYFTRNVVVDFEENRFIAWQHFARFVWRYDLEEVPDGTRVTESFTYDQPWAILIIWLGFPERNRRAMVASLERLERLATSSR